MTTTPADPVRKKLIEVSIPLEEISAESAREKSIRHGHPSTLHLWWSRKPLAAARAVLFAQLVDDPSSNPKLSEDEQRGERERLHGIIRRLVKWENVNNASLFREAYDEILKSTGGSPPAVLDPFAGGGSIPLEAQRLGLETHASDLNPVAVLINKALIEIPPKFARRPPVFPGAAGTKLGEWPRATGLAEDVRRYGAWVYGKAKERIGDLYPDATVVDETTGKETRATAIAWIWARTATCPNPACGIEMPLVNSWWLGKKKGKEAYVVPTVVDDADAPGGRRVDFAIGRGMKNAPPKGADGTMTAARGAICLACGSAVELAHLRNEGQEDRIGAALMAVVAAGSRRRVYVAPTPEHIAAAQVDRPGSLPAGKLDHDPRAITAPNYGMHMVVDLFTNRQLTALTTFSDLVDEVREKIVKDAAVVLPSGARLAEGGTGAEAYTDAVATYLGIIVSRLTDYQSSITTWASNPQMEILRNAFSRQAIPMVWGFAEGNPFGPSSGTLEIMIKAVGKAIDALPGSVSADAVQADAASRDYSSVVVSTDPPYYDNVPYSAISDFFYVWLRRSLREIHPALFASMLVPKAEELVANPYRHGGRAGAEKFFETGFTHVFARAQDGATDDYPITVYYAFKQSELRAEGVTSTGWATILEGMIQAGWAITATWPVRSERAGRMRDVGSNALASSIVLVLRRRNETAGQTTRRGFLTALSRELPIALEKLRQGAIAPVDLTQATIGPGMAVFSKYSRVVENDGSDMSVKSALRLINQALDEVLTEGEGDLDADTRFCLKWYEQYGWGKGPFGDADLLARSYDTSVLGIANSDVLTQGDGIVQLIAPADLPKRWNPVTDDRISVWEAMCHLARVLSAEDGGLETAAKLIAAAATRPEIDIESVQRLAYRLYEMTKTSRTDDARLFNLVGGAWTEVTEAAARLPVRTDAQGAFDFEGEG